jgi:hypothetical protein
LSKSCQKVSKVVKKLSKSCHKKLSPSAKHGKFERRSDQASNFVASSTKRRNDQEWNEEWNEEWDEETRHP